MTTVIGVLLIVMAVFLVIAVLMQSSKDHRLGASVAGGAETFFGKQKGKSMDALLNKLTTVIAIIFVLLVLILYFISDNAEKKATAGNDVAGGSDVNVEDNIDDSTDNNDVNLTVVPESEPTDDGEDADNEEGETVIEGTVTDDTNSEANGEEQE